MLSSIQEEPGTEGGGKTTPTSNASTPTRRRSITPSSFHMAPLTPKLRASLSTSSLTLVTSPQLRRSPSIASTHHLTTQDKKSFWTVLDVLSACILHSSKGRIDFYPDRALKDSEIVQTELALMLYEHYLQDLLHFEIETDPSSPTTLTSLTSPLATPLSQVSEHEDLKLQGCDSDESGHDQNEPLPETTNSSDESTPANIQEVVDYTGTLFDCLTFLDTRSKLLPWILDLPLEPGDDVNECLSAALSERPMKDDEPRVLFFKIMAYLCFALGDLLIQAGNEKQGYHMIRCSALILDRLLRFSKVGALHGQDILLYQYIFTKATEYSIDTMEAYEDGFEYASKLIASYEASAAAWIQVSTTDQSSAMTDAKPPNPYKHYYSRLLLSRASIGANLYSMAVQAYIKMLELLPLIRKEHIELTLPGTEHQDKILAIRLENRRDLCLKIVEVNGLARGDDAMSISYAKQALQLTRHPQSTTPGLSPDVAELEHAANDTVTESSLEFLIGRLCYQYVLTLAGGISVASSPPVAAVPHDGGVSIKSLLEESTKFLEEAFSSAVKHDDDPNGMRAVALQLSVVLLERREGEKALTLMKDYQLDDVFLEELESERLKSQNLSSEGYDTKLLTPFIHVFYSPDVYRRLLSLVRSQKSPKLDSTPSSNTLTGPVVTRIRRSQATPIQCTYCCMSFSNIEPFACGACGDHQIYFYYCSEECLRDDDLGHQTHCIKSKLSSARSLNEPESVSATSDTAGSASVVGPPVIEFAKMGLVSSSSVFGDFGHEALQFFKLSK